MPVSPLARSASWTLHSGFLAQPFARSGGRLFLLATGTMLTGWLSSVVDDAAQGNASWLSPIGASILVLWLMWQAYRLWQGGGVSLSSAMDLSWRGVVKAHRGNRSSQAPLAGWALVVDGKRPQPVNVRCTVNLGEVRLLRLSVASESSDVHSVYWCWVDLRHCDDAHYLRTLLALPSHLTSGGHIESHRVSVASSVANKHSGVVLPSQSTLAERRIARSPVAATEEVA
ncbi:MAG: hypothetical protein ACOYNB_08105 [Aquabacterium sp.]|uniref:hypothetical protein n=1 Tax=Aquabacterium sp. TaxID=1872578 RepID=UPI003BCC74B8